MKVAIHDGRFHADEAFSIATLKILGSVDYVRTRDVEILKSCDLRVDVGRKYNPETGDFDHHQPEGAGKRDNGVPYAAFGLIWKQYGAEACGNVEAADLVDKRLVQFLDAIDAGFDLFEPKVKGAMIFGVDKAIDNLMPSWKTNPSSDEVDKCFENAVRLASQLLERVIVKAKDQVDADEYVRNAVKNSSDKRLVVLDKYAPWQRVVIKEAADALFVAAPAWPADNNDWTLHVIDVEPTSFIPRKKLPSAWAGKNGSDLAAITGVSDAKFCHSARFMAVATSKDGVLRLAELALEDNGSNW